MHRVNANLLVTPGPDRLEILTGGYNPMCPRDSRGYVGAAVRIRPLSRCRRDQREPGTGFLTLYTEITGTGIPWNCVKAVGSGPPPTTAAA